MKKNLSRLKGQTLSPPQIKKEAFIHKKFDDKIKDPYHWLKKRDDPEVLNHIHKENEYSKQQLKPLTSLKKEMFEDIKSRLPKTEDQEPVSIGNYWYYKTWEKDKAYPIHKRKHKKSNNQEILLDENQLKGSYINVSNISVSPDHKILAYALDNKGREFYTIYFKDLKSGKLLKHKIPQVSSSFVWANDNKTLFYVKQDKETLRNFQVYRFSLKTGKNQLLYEEKDSQFSVYLNKSLCHTWITLLIYSSESTEYRYLPANQPDKNFILFCKREDKHEYHLCYGNKVFYLLSNKDKAFNFKVMKVSENTKQLSSYPSHLWKECIPHRPEVFIEDYEVFKSFIVLQVRKNAQLNIEIYPIKNLQIENLNFKEELYCVQMIDNEEYDSKFLRLRFESLVTPPIVYDYQWDDKKLYFKSQKKYKVDCKKYHSKREHAIAPDGTQVPISIVYKRDIKPNPKSPLLLYAYGSYGASMDPYFNPAVLALLNQGFIYAIAHVRGGSEKGRKWHEQGKMLNKKNTFTDFISCAEFLIEHSYSSPKHLYIMGESAGGLLIGAVLNQRPELFRGAVARVPFVDCLATMLDESIPLSTLEYKEWGNPNKKVYYDYIKSYSPYNNIKKAPYPYLLIETGYHDPRVQYWEPVKWLAKLREHNKNNHLMALVMNMKSGHFGLTGRLEYFKLKALCYSFFVGIEKGKI